MSDRFYRNREVSVFEARARMAPRMTIVQVAELALETNCQGLTLEDLTKTMLRIGWKSRAACPCQVVYCTLWAIFGSRRDRARGVIRPNNTRINFVDEYPIAESWYLHSKFIHYKERGKYARCAA